LEKPPAGGVTEVMVHPGLPDQSRDLAVANRELERYVTSGDRLRELEMCIEARGWAREWRLVTFKRLAEELAPPC
jgi:hypothetical protein